MSPPVSAAVQDLQRSAACARSLRHQPRSDERERVSAYVVALIDIKHPVEYEKYAEAFDFENFATEYGGEILTVSDEPEVI